MSAAKKNPSPYTAHLVVWLDMSGPTPKVVDQGIYGEARPSSLNLRTRYPVPLIHGLTGGVPDAQALEHGQAAIDFLKEAP